MKYNWKGSCLYEIKDRLYTILIVLFNLYSEFAEINISSYLFQRDLEECYKLILKGDKTNRNKIMK